MKNNKVKRVLAISVLGLFALTACDDIIAQPTQYEEPLIVAPESYTDEIHNNIASVVYDAVHDAGIGGDVLNQVLYLYAIDVFGPYNGNVRVNGKLAKDTEGVITLEQAYGDANLMNQFVQAHKAYWDSSDRDPAAAATQSEKERVEAKYESIRVRIAEEMYNKISGGTYTDRHVFSEKKLLKALRGSLESVSNPDELKPADLFEGQILPDLEPSEVFINPNTNRGYLHRDYYDSADNTYVVDEIIPGIYSQLLAEQYLLDETYNTLGRSYARKVNIIKINNNDAYPSVAYSLANELVREINAAPAKYADSRLAQIGVLKRFKEYSNAQIGYGLTTHEADIVKATGRTATLSPYGEVGYYYEATTYGDLASKYIKMKDVEDNGVNSEYENTFTNNGAYPVYVGLEQERKGLLENDYTTTGWYIKNGGLTDLPDSIRSRLFNIGVATGVKEKDPEASARTHNGKDWSEGEGENSYVCRINGHYYLKTATRVKGDAIDNDILHYDSSSKCYYIVEIEQAVSSSKLAKNGDHNYAKTLGEEEMQKIINEVSKIVGKGESYSTLATKKYLKEMSIEYHDDSVYDYFKSNYPELFDEEDTEESSEEETSAE